MQALGGAPAPIANDQEGGILMQDIYAQIKPGWLSLSYWQYYEGGDPQWVVGDDVGTPRTHTQGSAVAARTSAVAASWS